MRELSPEVMERRGGIGLRLRTLRKAAGLTVEEVGQRIGAATGAKGLKGTAVRNHENGWNGVPRDVLGAYADIYGASLSYLLRGDGEPPETLPAFHHQTDSGLQTYISAIADGEGLPTDAQWARILQLAGIK